MKMTESMKTEDTWAAWVDFFEPEDEDYGKLNFPALDDLTLDFRDMKLCDGEGAQIRVCQCLFLRFATFVIKEPEKGFLRRYTCP